LACQHQHLPLDLDALDGERQAAMHLLGETRSQGIGLGGDDSGRQEKAADLGVGGSVAQPQCGIGRKAAVNLDILPMALNDDSGADCQVCRDGQEDLYRLNPACGQQFSGSGIGG
jgi:hypothetical protein